MGGSYGDRNVQMLPSRKSASALTGPISEMESLPMPVDVGQLKLGSQVNWPRTTAPRGKTASQPMSESVRNWWNVLSDTSGTSAVSCAACRGIVVVVLVVVGGTRHATSSLARQRRTNFRPGVFTTLLPSGTATGTGHLIHGLRPLHRYGHRAKVQTPSRFPSMSQAGSPPRRQPSMQAR